MEFNHQPVMLNETIEKLDIKPEGIYVDGTIGGAGHSKEIIKKLTDKGLLIGIDRDLEAISVVKERLKGLGNFKIVHKNHDDIDEVLKELDIQKVDGILLDLGVSSYQLDEKERGFSYLGNARLDMRMDKTQNLSAFEVVNEYSENELAKILFEYGEEPFAKKIAYKICEQRKVKEIETTQELVQIIEKVKKYTKKGHVAKQTFQAIRIEVNNELAELKQTCLKCIKLLKSNGVLVIITFHSLEDRAVKEAFIEAQGKCECPKDLPCVCNKEKLGEIITVKPIEASEEEKNRNTRSRSAKLRAFKRII